MKILLVQPPFSEEGITSIIRYTPVGLIALAGYIREKSQANIEIYDSNVGKNHSINAITDNILQKNPQILGLTAMTTNIGRALQIAQRVKSNQPDIIVIIGGIHATISPEDVLSNEAVDYVIVGEGEITFDEFLKNINSPTEYGHIRGLGYKKNGRLIINQRRDLIKDIDELPFPAHDLLEIEQYNSPYGLKRPFVSMIRSRGCPFECIFCGVQKMFGRVYRVQTPKRTIQEIEYLINRFRVKEIGFKDSEFTLSAQNVNQFCDLLIEKNYDLIWTCNARVDCGGYELFKKMRRAGCHTVSFGAESGDQDVLNLLKKGITLQQTQQAIRNVQRAGMKASVNFMIGNPGETRETIKRTIRFSQAINPDYVYFGFTTPFPGTELSEMALKNNWLLVPDLNASLSCTRLTMNATNLSAKELNSLMRKAYWSFYFRPRYIMKRISMLNKEEIRTSIRGLAAVLRTIFRL